MPAYNSEHTIRQALESIAAQTLKPAEIIVVDDGSTDNTPLIASSFPGVKYVRQDNSGVSEACNTGAREASCQWIAFLDSDDIWEKEKLQTQIALIISDKSLVWCSCNGKYINKRTDTAGLIYPEAIAEELMKNGRMNYLDAAAKGLIWVRSTLLIRRDVFLEVGGFRKGINAAEDLDLFLNTAYKYPQIGYINQPLLSYFVYNQNSLSSVNLSKQIKDMSEVALSHLRRHKQMPILREIFKPRIKFWINSLCEEGQKTKAAMLYLKFFRYLSWSMRHQMLKRIMW